MVNRVGLLDLAAQKARYSAARQQVIAANVANADTPGYRAKDVEPFAQYLARAQLAPAQATALQPLTIDRTDLGAASPDRNTVSVETEMMIAGKAARDHETAIAIYAKAMSFLRTALGKAR